MKKILCILIVGIFLASTASALIVYKPIVKDSNDYEYNYQTFEVKETFKETLCDNVILYEGKYPVLKEFPPKSEELLAIMITDPQPTVATSTLPSAFSWLDFGGDWSTPAKDQGSCGSCWAFGALGAMEAAVKIESADSGWNPDLSEQYVLSCLKAAGSCNGGWMSEALLYIQSTSPGYTGNSINGNPIESCMPYTATDYVPCDNKCADWDTFSDPPEQTDKLFQIVDVGVTQISPTNPSDWDLLKSWIYTYGPITVDIYASGSWSSYWWSHHSSTDVYYGSESSTTNHAQVVYGWVDTPGNPDYQGYWILKNSWGTGFGYSGFNNLAYGKLRLGDRDASWVTTTEWPQQPGEDPDPDPTWPDPHVSAVWNYRVGNDNNNIYPKLGDEVEFRDQSNGPVVLWEWDFDGDGVIDISGFNAKNPKWTYYEEGEYFVTLTVWSSAGLSSTLTKTVEVKEIWAPMAVVDPLYYGDEDYVISFEGRFSYDVDGEIVSYLWNSGNGDTSTERHVVFTYPDQNGEYTLTLAVTDDDGATGTKEVEVKIDKSMPPETEAVPGGIGGYTEWFNGDVKVDIITTDWSGVKRLYFMVDGDESADSWDDGIYCYGDLEYIYDSLTVEGHGTHTVDFYAIDIHENIENHKSKQIKIDNQLPTLNIEVQGNTVTLTASDADSGVAVIKYYLYGTEYDYSGPFTIAQGGSHNLVVVVEDVAKNTYEESTTITIEEGPSTPLIDGPHSGKAGTSYDFTFESTDPSGGDVSFYIEWGDETIKGWTTFVSSGAIKTEGHTWDEDGDFTIRAKSKNRDGSESGWGTWSVSMPKSKNLQRPLLFRFLEKYPFIYNLFKQLLNIN